MKLGRRKIKVLSDEELLSYYQKEMDKSVIGELYERYGHLVFGTCLKYLTHKNDAEDVVSTIFFQLGEKILKSEIKYFKSWLYTVVKNECLMILRKKKYIETDIPEELLSIKEEENDKELLELKIETLEQEIDELNPPQGEVIRLFYIENKTYKEISVRLQLELKKVKSALQNGKRNLRIKLGKHEQFTINK